MKISELNLIAFGPFTGCQLDLSGGDYGLHLVYGPNEAGKSTSLLAITYLLYGFPQQTSVDFKYSYKNLRVGGRLQARDGRELSFVRRKAQQKTLRCAADQEPLDDVVLKPFLGDVDQLLFSNMFGINHERLRTGGRDIALGNGRLGELLFAAGAGLVDLQQLQHSLRTDSEQLLKASGRSGSIYSNLQAYVQQRKAAEAALVSVEAWQQVDRLLRDCQEEKRVVDVRLGQAQRERERLQRIKLAAPIFHRLRGRREELQQLAPTPNLPEDFAATSNRLLMELRASEAQYQSVASELKMLAAQLTELRVPESLLLESQSIEALRDRIGAIRGAVNDRANVESKRDSFVREAKQILLELGRPAELDIIEELRLPRDKTVKIQSLGGELERLSERQAAAVRNGEKLQRELENAQRRLTELPVATDIDQLRASLRFAQQQGDLELDWTELTSEIQRCHAQIELSLKRLPLFEGTLAELEALALPNPATMDRFAREWTEAEHRCHVAKQLVQDDDAALAALRLRLAEMESAGTIPTLAELIASRQIRDEGWQLIVQAWRQPPPAPSDLSQYLEKFSAAADLLDAFRLASREADRVADALRQDADRVATKAKLELDCEQLSQRKQQRQHEQVRAEQRLTLLKQQWDAQWSALRSPPLSPEEMHAWYRQTQDILTQIKQWRELQHRQTQLQSRIEQCRKRLLDGLRTVSVDNLGSQSTLAELQHRSQEMIDCEQQRAAMRNQLNQQVMRSREELASYQAEQTQIEQLIGSTRTQWSEEMRLLGLEPAALPAQANSRLGGLQSLFEAHKEAERYRTRLEHIDRDVAQFAQEVKQLAERLLPEQSEDAFDATFQQLMGQLQQARLAAEQRDQLRQRQQRLSEQQQQLQSEILRTSGMLTEMTRLAQVSKYDELATAAEQSRARQSLERQIHELEDELLSLSAGRGLAALQSEVEHEQQLDGTITGRQDSCQQLLVELGEQRDDILNRLRTAEIEQAKFDGSEQALEQHTLCEDLALRLESEIEAYSVLKVAASVLSAAIERHRQRNQGPVLSRAAEIFRDITLGQFTGLQAEFNERGEPILVGIRASHSPLNQASDLPPSADLAGELPLFATPAVNQAVLTAPSAEQRVTVEGMSDGTCDQLYLALRVASLEHWLEHHEPVPFIVDDVLMNFDDGRAVATLRVLAQLSRRTQVIFFTHHYHLVELARQHLSDDQLFVSHLGYSPSSAVDRE